MSLQSNLEEIKNIKKELYSAIKQINDNIQPTTPFSEYPQMILETINNEEVTE